MPRIISLLPAATEMVYILGLEQSLVGISHDSDYPAETKEIQKITSSSITASATSREIDQAVKNSLHTGQSLFHVNEELLLTLQPDLILTQELCRVCAPSYTQVMKAAKVLESNYSLISLEPESIDDIFENILTIGKYTQTVKRANQEVSKLKTRLEKVGRKILKRTKTPRVAVIEWLDPLMVAAHWVPEMITIAGGETVLAKPGEKSREVLVDEVISANPDILIIAPCGFPVERTKKELFEFLSIKELNHTNALQYNQVFLLDGNAYLTRPGPRLIDGVEILSEILHPGLFKRKHLLSDWQPID